MAVPSVLDVPEMMKAVSYSTYGGGAEGLEVILITLSAPPLLLWKLSFVVIMVSNFDLQNLHLKLIIQFFEVQAYYWNTCWMWYEIGCSMWNCQFRNRRKTRCWLRWKLAALILSIGKFRKAPWSLSYPIDSHMYQVSSTLEIIFTCMFFTSDINP